MKKILLSSILANAYDAVLYYKETFSNLHIDYKAINEIEDLKKLPLLFKDQVQANPDKFLSAKYLYFPESSNLVMQKTSGSTGRFLKVYWSQQDLVRSNFYLWNVRRRIYGIDPEMKFCTFHSTVYRGNKLIEPLEVMTFNNERTLSFSKLNLDNNHLTNYYKKMLEFEPVWLFIQPSIAVLLANFIEENNLKIPPSLKYIEMIGEYVFDNNRKVIEEVFKVPTANMYGSMETNGIAIDCENKHLHCITNNVLVEIINNGKCVEYGEEGDIYVTCLTNTAMPFIRYCLGDRGILYPGDTCSCGNKNPVIKVLAGRTNENVLLEGKEPINSFVLVYLVELVNKQCGDAILEFQIIQEDYGKFKALFVLKHSHFGWKDTITNHFIESTIKLGFGQVKWEVSFVDDFKPDAVTGKLQFFINKIIK